MVDKTSREIDSLERKIEMRKSEAIKKDLFNKIKYVAQGNSEKDHYFNNHGDDWDERKDTWVYSHEGITFEYVDYDGWYGRSFTSKANTKGKELFACTYKEIGENSPGITCYLPGEWETNLQKEYNETKERKKKTTELAAKQKEEKKLQDLKENAKKFGFD